MGTPTVALLAASSFLVPGIVCLFWPEKIQAFAVKYYEHHRYFGRVNPFLDWMKTGTYVVHLRIGGVLCICAAGLILFSMMRGIEK